MATGIAWRFAKDPTVIGTRIATTATGTKIAVTRTGTSSLVEEERYHNLGRSRIG